MQVKAVLGIFCDNALSALETYQSQLQIEDGTIFFVRLVSTWWKVVNVKRPTTGVRKRDPLQDPITSMDSPQVKILREFLQFLLDWKSPTLTSLSSMTMPGLRLTVTSLINVTQRLLNDTSFSYVLLGKFQSDVIESRFGEYRQLGGARYHVSVSDVFQSETKVRLKQLISRTKTHGPIRIQLSEVNECADDPPFSSQVFNQDIPNDYFYFLSVSDMSKPELETVGYVAGYIQKKNDANCIACGILPKIASKHVENINRGGLTQPSFMLIQHVEFWLQIFKTIVRDRESDFFSNANIRSFLCSLLFKVVQMESSHFHENDESCIKNSIFTFSNIILKDYCMLQNRKISDKKNDLSLKRKLKKLSNQ